MRHKIFHVFRVTTGAGPDGRRWRRCGTYGRIESGDWSRHRNRLDLLHYPQHRRHVLPVHCFPLCVPAMHLEPQDAGRDTNVLCLDDVYHHLLRDRLHGLGHRDHVAHPPVLHDHSLLHEYADANTCQEPASSDSWPKPDSLAFLVLQTLATKEGTERELRSSPPTSPWFSRFNIHNRQSR